MGLFNSVNKKEWQEDNEQENSYIFREVIGLLLLYFLSALFIIVAGFLAKVFG